MAFFWIEMDMEIPRMSFTSVAFSSEWWHVIENWIHVDCKRCPPTPNIQSHPIAKSNQRICYTKQDNPQYTWRTIVLICMTIESYDTMESVFELQLWTSPNQRMDPSDYETRTKKSQSSYLKDTWPRPTIHVLPLPVIWPRFGNIWKCNVIPPHGVP